MNAFFSAEVNVRSTFINGVMQRRRQKARRPFLAIMRSIEEAASFVSSPLPCALCRLLRQYRTSLVDCKRRAHRPALNLHKPPVHRHPFDPVKLFWIDHDHRSPTAVLLGQRFDGLLRRRWPWQRLFLAGTCISTDRQPIHHH